MPDNATLLLHTLHIRFVRTGSSPILLAGADLVKDNIIQAYLIYQQFCFTLLHFQQFQTIIHINCYVSKKRGPHRGPKNLGGFILQFLDVLFLLSLM